MKPKHYKFKALEQMNFPFEIALHVITLEKFNNNAISITMLSMSFEYSETIRIWTNWRFHDRIKSAIRYGYQNWW